MGDKVTDEEADFIYFVQKIKLKFGLDLHSYKQAQVYRRLTNLRKSKGYGTFREFFSAMEKQTDLYRDFMNQLTINVTEFYRNHARWDVLCKDIAPMILRNNGRIRCWSAACSTGEEPYSLVMALSSVTSMKNIEVHATDLDGRVLEQAKAGIFAPRLVTEIPKDKLQRFFRLEQGNYHIAEDVKRQIQFRQHNLLADPFGQDYDLIVCRNVLIYFTDEAKQNLYKKFHQALRAGGYLFVGGTEQMMSPEKYGFQSDVSFFYKKS